MLTKELTGLEVLGIAIRSEQDAQNIYREIADKVSCPRAKERFHLLVAEEQQHEALLTRKYNELYPEVPIALPPSQLPQAASTSELRKCLTLLEVLDLAIREERHSRDLYLEACSHMEDLTGKAMLKYLADMEYAHMMSLNAEYDMLVKYPNYYEGIAEPWREELGLRKDKL
jgi:rubrerythrin